MTGSHKEAARRLHEALALPEKFCGAPILREKGIAVAAITQREPSRHDRGTQLEEQPQVSRTRVLKILKESGCAASLLSAT